MKKIIITGANSFIGTRFENWLGKYPVKYKVDTIDMKNELWKEIDFSLYDVVFHVAGIAHIKEKKENQALYYKVNRDLAFETAKKAKTDGVKQFILLSSMSIYGIENGIIDENTPLNPKSIYGKSKLQAEELIRPLECDNFKVVILRPPMIYGKGCKGNYPKLAKMALKVPIFANVDNKRSMIYIDNFCEIIRMLIDDDLNGLFFPQNSEYVKTSEMVRLIAKSHGKNIRLTKLFNPILRLMNIKIINKVFGDLVYDKRLSHNLITINSDDENYELVSFNESISRTEN